MSENISSDLCIQQRFNSACMTESSLGAFWIAKNTKFLHGDNKNGSDCAEVQADLTLHWTHMSKGTFSHDAAQIKPVIFWF